MKVNEILKALRVTEISVKTGFILIGALFSLKQINPENSIILSQLFLISFIAGLGVYAINSFFGYHPDSQNSRLSSQFHLSKKQFGFIAIICVGIILLWLFYLDYRLGVLSFIVFGLWTIYVVPSVNLKGRPFGGLIIAFLAQMTHFSIGVYFVGDYSMELFYWCIFFALIFTTGHIWHELIDFDADKLAGNTSTSVMIGKYNSAWLGQVFFFLSTVYLAIVSYLELLEMSMVIPFFLAYIAQRLFFRVMKIRNDQSQEKIFKYRRLYMLSYFIATFIVIGVKSMGM